MILLGLALSTSTAEEYHVRITLISAGILNLIFIIWDKVHDPGQWDHGRDLIIDYGFAVLIFLLSGGIKNHLGWVGLLPLMTAALYWRIKGALFFSIVNIVWQGAIVWLQTDALVSGMYALSLAPLYLLPGVVVGYIANQMDELNLPQVLSSEKESRPKEKSEKASRNALYKLVSTLSATLNYQRVLEAALDLSASALASPNGEEEKLVCAVLLHRAETENGTILSVGSARRYTPADTRIVLNGTHGLLGQAIEKGQPVGIRNPEKDPELGRIVAMRVCQSAYAIPLQNGMEIYGILLYGHPDKNYFTSDYREILDIIGNQAMVAIQNARLYHELEVEKERVYEIQEESRKKLARDLHDGPTQSVSALAMRVNFARRLLERDSAAAADELFKIEELARRTTKEIRHMLFTLRPLVLESQGLIAALESMAEKMGETYSQKVVVQADRQVVPALEMGKQGVIFYIAEEAVNNARKHAQADQIIIRIKFTDNDVVLLEVEDNGKGFDPNSVNENYDQRGSLGMVNMRERTDLINGIFQLESKPGRGTRIRVLVPLTEQAADRLRRGG